MAKNNTELLAAGMLNKFPSDMSEIAELLAPGLKTVTLRLDDDDAIDRMNAAYWAEYERWCWRRKAVKDGFELVRNSSPNNDIIADEYNEITNLTKRECRDRDEAEAWYQTYAKRAAMRAALGAL